MKKFYFFIAMMFTAFIANAQTPVTIVNADFGLPSDGAKYRTINSIVAWKSDDLVDNDNGREPNYVAYMLNTGGSIYNVLAEVISTTETTYKLTFDGWVGWNPEAPSEVDFVVTFSSLANGADPKTRVAIKTVKIVVGTDPNTAEVTIPAGAAYAGANLVIEVDCNTPSLTNTNTWVSFDNFALTKTEVVTKVQNAKSVSIKTYPNPFSDKVTVESAETIKSVGIYSTAGKNIKAVVVNSTKAIITTSNLPKGLYLLKIETENGVKNLNVVK
jgi:hypothetical protein